MNDNRDQEEKLVISFSDILTLFRRFKKKILYWAFALGLMGVLLALLKPVSYRAEGTFKEKTMKTSNLPTSMLQMLSHGPLIGGSDSEAISLIKSRKLMNEVINKLHLQAYLRAESDLEGLLTTVKHNLQVLRTAFTFSPHPALKEFCCPLTIETLNYEGEIPLVFALQLEEDGSYEVSEYYSPHQVIGRGRLGESFQFEQGKMVLVPTASHESLIAQKFYLKIDPRTSVAEKLLKILKVEPSKDDKNLLKISFVHRNRHLACSVVNCIMETYQEFLETHHDQVAQKQLNYLNSRRDQLTNDLISLMKQHADFLSNDIYGAGFIDSNKEMDFLARSLDSYKQKLMTNELEIKRLERVKPNTAHYERYSITGGDADIINTILTEIRTLKQQRDTLEIEQQKKSLAYSSDLQRSLEQQLDELKEVQRYQVELREIATQFQQGGLPQSNSKLLNDGRFLLKGWFERLQKAQGNEEEWKQTQESFHFYLVNLERSFNVYERILQERLTHQQNPSGEYQGITLKVATELYLEYSKQVIQMEATIRQNLFFIRQIEDPHFEITSLSSGLSDPVSAEIIRKANTLVLNLRDQNNQSVREQERIKEELSLQRTFLRMHLQQMVQLMELHKELMDEKIFALQNVSLELIHQQISLLEKNLQDYVQSRLQNLHEERQLIQVHLRRIHDEMATLPRKWTAEQLITQEVGTNQLIVEEIAKMVETKNISHNLEVIQSSPVDLSFPPVHPLTPQVLLWGILGFIFGGCIGSGLVLGKSLSQGVTVSAQNLKLKGYHVSGPLIPPLHVAGTHHLQNVNLDTLRRLQAYLDVPSSDGTTSDAHLVLLLEGKGPHYAPDFAHLLCQRGQKVLTIDLNALDATAETTPGLLHYLQGKVKQPPILQEEHGDRITAGGENPFLIDMIRSPVFHQLLEQLKSKYDWIVVASRVLPCSAEAEILIPLFPSIAVTLQQEKTDDLHAYAMLIEQGSRYKISFMLASEQGWT